RTYCRHRRNDANDPIPDLTCEPLHPDILRFFVAAPPHIRRRLDVVGLRSLLLLQPGRGSDETTRMNHAARRSGGMRAACARAAAGVLIAYGFSLPLVYRRCAALVDKILSGMSPVDIPVEIPTGWELVIKRETARALGIEVPTSLLLRALAIAARR